MPEYKRFGVVKSLNVDTKCWKCKNKIVSGELRFYDNGRLVNSTRNGPICGPCRKEEDPQWDGELPEPRVKQGEATDAIANLLDSFKTIESTLISVLSRLDQIEAALKQRTANAETSARHLNTIASQVDNINAYIESRKIELAQDASFAS